jgi:hypothetical protein
MKKLITTIIFILGIVFLGINKVEAASVTRICKYTGTVNGKPAEFTLNIYGIHKVTADTNYAGEELVDNWDDVKKTYYNNTTCPTGVIKSGNYHYVYFGSQPTVKSGDVILKFNSSPLDSEGNCHYDTHGMKVDKSSLPSLINSGGIFFAIPEGEKEVVSYDSSINVKFGGDIDDFYSNGAWKCPAQMFTCQTSVGTPSVGVWGTVASGMGVATGPLGTVVAGGVNAGSAISSVVNADTVFNFYTKKEKAEAGGVSGFFNCSDGVKDDVAAAALEAKKGYKGDVLDEEQVCIDNPEKCNFGKGDTGACSIIDQASGDDGLFGLLKKIVGYVQIGTILLVIVLGVLDFTGAVGSSDDAAFKKAGGKFVKRLIAGALVFLVPALINTVLFVIKIGPCAESGDDQSQVENLFN